ncbi:hypothetical protein [Nocardia noduli]|uniref:hypothetical protein n=1 Tax=Nocardia noduli TaxID=2815722 RepID=UPI001C232AAC|nr:hypothetical protein [Nocardia noduli]
MPTSRTIPAILHTVVRILLQALMYVLLASFAVDMIATLVRRRDLTAAAHDAVARFGDDHHDSL